MQRDTLGNKIGLENEYIVFKFATTCMLGKLHSTEATRSAHEAARTINGTLPAIFNEWYIYKVRPPS